MDKPKYHPELESPDNLGGVRLEGYLGRSTTAGRDRLYPSLADRSTYVEFSEADVLSYHDTGGGKVAVILRPSAKVTHIQRSELTTEASFLRGDISSSHLSSRAAMPITASPFGAGVGARSLDPELCVTYAQTHCYTCRGGCVQTRTCAEERVVPTYMQTHCYTCRSGCVATRTCPEDRVAGHTMDPDVCAPTYAQTHCYTCRADCFPTRTCPGE